MLSLLAAAILCAEPVVVVRPFEVMSSDPADANLGRAMQSLVEADLKAAGLTLRIDETPEPKADTKLLPASHLVLGSLVALHGRVKLAVRVVEVPNTTIATASAVLFAGDWNGRQPITNAVLQAFKKPAPLGAEQLRVDDALLRAWGDALHALEKADPAAAKKKVADVVKRWPDFTPAKERLARL